MGGGCIVVEQGPNNKQPKRKPKTDALGLGLTTPNSSNRVHIWKPTPQAVQYFICLPTHLYSCIQFWACWKFARTLMGSHTLAHGITRWKMKWCMAFWKSDQNWSSGWSTSLVLFQGWCSKKVTTMVTAKFQHRKKTVTFEH